MPSAVRLRVLRTREPISLPQHRRLLCAAKRVERVGGDAGAILGPGMVASENLVVSSESALAKSERFSRTTHEKQQAKQIGTCPIGIWMIRAECLFAYRERALIERPRPCKVALVLEQQGEVTEARRRVMVLRAECLFAYRQRTLVKRTCLREVPLGLK